MTLTLTGSLGKKVIVFDLLDKNTTYTNKELNYITTQIELNETDL